MGPVDGAESAGAQQRRDPVAAQAGGTIGRHRADQSRARLLGWYGGGGVRWPPPHGRCLVAEDGLDPVGVLGEALAVFLLGRGFTLPAAVVEVELEQFAEQVRACGLLQAAQVLLDRGRLPGQPGLLEAVAD